MEAGKSAAVKGVLIDAIFAASLSFSMHNAVANRPCLLQAIPVVDPMSDFYIGGVVENIREGNILTPIVEVLVNAIRAVEETGREDGRVEVVMNREHIVDQGESAALGDIVGFTVIDNGIGFTAENRNSFDRLFSTLKAGSGGKGFGRFICLKYYKDVYVNSVFQKNEGFECRRFHMGKDIKIIEGEECFPVEASDTRTEVVLSSFRRKKFPKEFMTVAHLLMERVLPFFFEASVNFPEVIICEEGEHSERLCLNHMMTNQAEAYIQEIKVAGSDFDVEGESFRARIFKCYASQRKTSQVILVGHRREVTSKSLSAYVTEFSGEYYDKAGQGEGRNFTIHVYVQSDYLDAHVRPERGDFDFPKSSDLFCPVLPEQIEKKAALLAVKALQGEIESRVKKKIQRAETMVREQAPWLAHLLPQVDLSRLPYKATLTEIKNHLGKEVNSREEAMQSQFEHLMNTGTSEDLQKQAKEMISQISEAGRNELAHYVALRRCTLGLFEKSLQLDEHGQYPYEEVVHNIIFPMQSDSEKTSFFDHNLWLLDERLNFAEYVSSDLPIPGDGYRPDLLAFGRRVAFRSGNEPSNPITVFEFKRPMRDDFANPSSSDDPVQAIIDYVIKLQDGHYRTPTGRELRVTTNTPCYGYVVCDLNEKVRQWLRRSRDCKPMPDNSGFFHRHESLSLYIEVLSWDKVLKDATMRNRIFFHKLGIDL